MMDNKHEQEKFINFSRQLLDKSLDEIDDSVLRRLKVARQLAIQASPNASQESPKKTSFPAHNALFFPSWIAPASMATAFATLTIATILFLTEPSPISLQAPSLMEDIHLLSANDELEFYQNLEFYLWLDDESAS